MTRRPRRNHSPAFKAKVALAALTREREQLTDRIESLQKMLADEKSERRQLTALLTDQRPKAPEPSRKGLSEFQSGACRSA